MSTHRLVALLLGILLALAGCTSNDRTVGAAGGSVRMTDDERVEVAVPRGATDGSVDVTVSPAANAPPPPPGMTLLGTAVEVKVSEQVAGARVLLPVGKDAVGPAGKRDFFMAVYSDSLQTWVPLITDYDPAQRRASATVPHFSTIALFGYDVPGSGTVGGGLRWVGNAAGDAVHDIAGGVKNFAGGLIDGMKAWVSGGELKEPDCDKTDKDWTVKSSAKEVSGCIVSQNEDLDLRLGNTYRMPFALAAPAGSAIGPTESDYGLDLIDYIMRSLNGAAGLGSLAQRGTTSLGLPRKEYPYGSILKVRVKPDLLGTALHVIVGLLSGIPGKKVLTEQVDRELVRVLWDARDQSIDVLIFRLRETFTHNLGKPEDVERLETFFDAASCATKSIQGAVNSARTGEASELAKAVVEVAKECTGQALKAADSALTEAWDTLKGSWDARN